MIVERSGKGNYMAISSGSTLGEKERIVTLAVDRYGDEGIAGAVYRGSARRGREFCGFLELVEDVEEIFREIHYPREVFRVRSCAPEGELPASAAGGSSTAAAGAPVQLPLRRDGRLATCTLRIRQRQHASWQGTVTDSSDGTSFAFRSFLELLEYLDSRFGGRSLQDPTDAGASRISGPDPEGAGLRHTIARVLLPTALEGTKGRPEIMEIYPDVVACRFRGDAASHTFMVKILFLENHTCQGVLHWRGGAQASFRSFLELVRMVGKAGNSAVEQAGIVI